jgi:hypothetical protein
MGVLRHQSIGFLLNLTEIQLIFLAYEVKSGYFFTVKKKVGTRIMFMYDQRHTNKKKDSK